MLACLHTSAGVRSSTSPTPHLSPPPRTPNCQMQRRARGEAGRDGRFLRLLCGCGQWGSMLVPIPLLACYSIPNSVHVGAPAPPAHLFEGFSQSLPLLPPHPPLKKLSRCRGEEKGGGERELAGTQEERRGTFPLALFRHRPSASHLSLYVSFASYHPLSVLTCTIRFPLNYPLHTKKRPA